MRVCLQVGAYIDCLVVNADFFAPDFAEAAADRIPAALFSAQDLAEDFFQAAQVRTFQQFFVVDGRLITADFPGEILRAKITHTGLFTAHGKFFGKIFVHLVFQKALHQLLTGVALLPAGLFVLFARQQHAALDVQERRRHDEEFTGNIHVLAVHLPDVFQVLVCDLRDRNVVDVDFVFFDQVYEKIQRALKHREFYRNCHDGLG